MALLNSLYSRSKERISLPLLSCWPKYKKLSLPYQLLLLPQSLPQSASLRAVAVCVAVGWLCCCCCCELISSGAAFDSTQRDATQTRRDATCETRRGDATRCHEKHLDGFRSASVCWQISDASATKIRPKIEKTQKKFKRLNFSNKLKEEKKRANKRQNVY